MAGIFSNGIPQNTIDRMSDLKPKGWDKEDEYLENAAKQQKREDSLQPKPKFELIEGTNEGEYTCAHCKYQFRYNVREMKPRNCPYCGKENIHIY